MIEHGRHPDLDTMFTRHERLLRWMDRRLCDFWQQPHGTFLGSLLLRLNHHLFTYAPAKGTLSTYLMRFVLRDIDREFRRFDAERWRRRYYDWRRPEHKRRRMLPLNDIDEERDLVFRPEERDGPADAIRGAFPTSGGAFWDFACADLPLRLRVILEERFIHKRKLRQIAVSLKVTRERARQLEAKALRLVRARIKADPRFAREIA